MRRGARLEVQDRCKACAMEKCSEERSSCLEDDACTTLLDCKGICGDPACLLDCEAEHGFSAWYEDLWECVLNDSCPDECRSNQNWGCLGNYDWTPSEDPRFAVTFRFENPRTTAWLSGDSRAELGVVGAQARTCAAPPDSDCMLGEIDSDVVDVTESVRLDVEFAGSTRIFGGRLEVENEAHGPFGLRERFLGLPLNRAGAVRVFFGTRDFLQASSGGALDSRRRRGVRPRRLVDAPRPLAAVSRLTAPAPRTCESVPPHSSRRGDNAPRRARTGCASPGQPIGGWAAPRRSSAFTSAGGRVHLREPRRLSKTKPAAAEGPGKTP